MLDGKNEMKFWEIILIIALMYPFAVAGAQYITRFLKLKSKTQSKKIWRFELPTTKELIYAPIAVIALGIFMYKQGLFD